MTGRMTCNGETVVGYTQLQTICIWPQGYTGVIGTFLVCIPQLQIYVIYKNEHELSKISSSAEVESHSDGQENSHPS